MRQKQRAAGELALVKGGAVTVPVVQEQEEVTYSRVERVAIRRFLRRIATNSGSTVEETKERMKEFPGTVSQLHDDDKKITSRLLDETFGNPNVLARDILINLGEDAQAIINKIRRVRAIKHALCAIAGISVLVSGAIFVSMFLNNYGMVRGTTVQSVSIISSSSTVLSEEEETTLIQQ